MTANNVNAHGFDLDAAATLDPSIQPLNRSVDLTAAPSNVFLTGSTGFVGAFLMHNIFKNTDARIHALVRADDAEHGHKRIKSNLQKYNIWRDSYARRLIAVPGDLKDPLLGQTEEKFAELAEVIDVIYHCGSKLSYIAPYEYLANANVGGTQEALRLATTTRPKPLHFVSSLGILLAYDSEQLKGGGEDDPMKQNICPEVGYFQTKYVSERVVRIARDRGIPVTIHRIGLIVGDTTTGVSNVDDFVARIILGSIQAGYAPGITNAMDMTPVNYVAEAMYFLSRQQESIGQVFHLLNPEPITWGGIFDYVIDRGYDVEKMDFHHWVDALDKHADPDENPLYPMLPFFHISFAQRMLGISKSHFNALGTEKTQKALEPWGKTCPPIDAAAVNTYLQRFVETGRLHKVETTTA